MPDPDFVEDAAYPAYDLCRCGHPLYAHDYTELEVCTEEDCTCTQFDGPEGADA